MSYSRRVRVATVGMLRAMSQVWRIKSMSDEDNWLPVLVIPSEVEVTTLVLPSGLVVMVTVVVDT